MININWLRYDMMNKLNNLNPANAIAIVENKRKFENLLLNFLLNLANSNRT